MLMIGNNNTKTPTCSILEVAALVPPPFPFPFPFPPPPAVIELEEPEEVAVDAPEVVDVGTNVVVGAAT